MGVGCGETPRTLGSTIVIFRTYANNLAGLLAQSVMSATDTLGHWDVGGLSATEPRPRQWICICTMPKDVGMPS